MSKSKEFENTDMEIRQAMGKLVMKLFSLWNLCAADQLKLLGLSPNSRALPTSKDLLDRVRRLLSIHKALRTLYPRNPEICYAWITMCNPTLNNISPLDVMKEEGLIGIAKVSQYLNYQLVT